jgi:hypothetical protein
MSALGRKADVYQAIFLSRILNDRFHQKRTFRSWKYEEIEGLLWARGGHPESRRLAEMTGRNSQEKMAYLASGQG